MPLRSKSWKNGFFVALDVCAWLNYANPFKISWAPPIWTALMRTWCFPSPALRLAVIWSQQISQEFRSPRSRS